MLRLFGKHVQNSLAVAVTTLLFLSLASSSQAGPLEEETKRLLARLPKASNEESEAIIRRLAEIGPEAQDAKAVLFELLQQGKFIWDTQSALASMGGEAIPFLRKGLKHHNSLTRVSAIWAIGEMGRDANPLAEDLVQAIVDEDEDVRIAAIAALGNLKLKPATTALALARLVVTRGRFPAAHAADALYDMGPVGQPATAALEKAATTHTDPYVRGRALGALLAVDGNGEAAVRALSHCLRDRGADDSWSVERVAAEQLRHIGQKTSKLAPVLLQILKSSRIRQNQWRYDDITFSLPAVSLMETLPLLRRDMTHKPRRVGNESFFSSRHRARCIRASAAAAVARLAPNKQKAIAQLRKILEEPASVPTDYQGNSQVDPSAIAAAGLRRLGSDAVSTLPLLKRLMNKDRTDLAMKAAWAVARIDRRDRWCLEVLKHADWDPDSRESPFHRESPKEVASVLGDRIDALAPQIFEAAIDDHQHRRYFVEIVVRAGPSMVVALVNRAFQIIEKSKRGNPSQDAYLTLDVLGQRAQPALSRLIVLSESRNHYVRAEAAHLLGVIGQKPKEVLPPLKSLVEDNRVLVRSRSSQAIGKFGAQAMSLRGELRRLTGDRYQSVRESATNAIAAIEKANHGRGK